MRRRWKLIAIAVVVILVASLAGGLIAANGSASKSGGAATSPPTSAATSPPTSPAPVLAADVAAARACQAFQVYVADAETGTIPKAVGSRLVTDAGILLKGAKADHAAGRALPKWAALGSELLAAAADVLADKISALKADGADAQGNCALVPAAAARAGGYTRS
jgi:hypothetical protein